MAAGARAVQLGLLVVTSGLIAPGVLAGVLTWANHTTPASEPVKIHPEEGIALDGMATLTRALSHGAPE